MAALLLCLLGCGRDSDDEVEDSSNVLPEFFEVEDSSNVLPEFYEGMGDNPRDAGGRTTTMSDGVEIVRDALGGIKWIIFVDAKGPTSAATLFTDYMGLSPAEYLLYRKENNDWMTNPLTVECYQQHYQGVVVYQGGYAVRFQNGRVTSANGTFIKISNLDVKPSFDEQKAKEIYARYLKEPVEEIDAGKILAWFDDALMISEFPMSKGSSEWAPRLVYGLNRRIYYDEEKNDVIGLNDEGCCFVDAHTGRILQTWPNYIE